VGLFSFSNKTYPQQIFFSNFNGFAFGIAPVGNEGDIAFLKQAAVIFQQPAYAKSAAVFLISGKQQFERPAGPQPVFDQSQYS
jgi:hypothetical protein